MAEKRIFGVFSLRIPDDDHQYNGEPQSHPRLVTGYPPHRYLFLNSTSVVSVLVASVSPGTFALIVMRTR